MASQVERLTLRDESDNAAHECHQQDSNRHEVGINAMQPSQPDDRDEQDQGDGHGDDNTDEARDLLLDNGGLGLATSRQLVNTSHQGIVSL